MSNASMLERLSCNIFITNLPAYFSSKDLWNTCSKFGTVLDVYIPKKVSKQGKRYAFARFKKVSNVDSLISSLRSVWLGSFHLYANVARFNRGTKTSDSQKSHSNVPLNTSKPSYAKVLGKNESPQNHDELPWTPHFEVQDKIVWIDVEALKVIIKGKVYVVRAKEVTCWVSDFGEENSDESEDYSDNNSVGKKNWVEPEEGEIIPESVQNDAFIDNIAKSEPINGDSRENQSAHEMNDSNPKFPSGFTPQHSDHYEYEKVEALRESTTPQDSKKVLGWLTMRICCLFLFILLKNYPSKWSFGITCWRPLIVGMVRSLLWEILMRGYSFTWSDKHASKMSKLDQFLVSQGMLDLFPNLIGLILHRHLFDHRPILLKETRVDYGHTPFRLYHSWFLKDDFHSVIEDSWNNDGNGLPDDLTKRANLFRDLKYIDHKESIDLAQKAKIKWAVEGDENSKKFHGVVNKKRRHLAIKGCNSSFIALIPKVIDAKHLKDFKHISLIGCQYKIIGKILANRLSLVIGDIVSQEQSAFIKERQIMDGPLIFNEVISWCKARKEQLLTFKVDFQKAFDSVRWDHLDDILGKFGFEIKWREWIRGCLQSSKASILVNGSPTDEFSFHRGLRQGDPLSSFLFILVMESLHVSFQRLIDRGMFDPIFLGKENRVPISHLFYADDAMFIGKWSRSNVNVLMMMLHCFSLASGLKVNVHKSSIYGVGVRQDDVQHMAENFCCISNNLPFTYLGVKVGANMMRLNSWSDVVKKVSNKLSNWKAKTLSVGGRLTLLKSVLGAIPTYYMFLFKAPEVIISLLEKMRNKFFLGADTDDRKITWVCWNKVLAH
nr:RNA-directed DNA polymerase, eukaryota [Tanacetum cinerariifolium]